MSWWSGAGFSVGLFVVGAMGAHNASIPALSVTADGATSGMNLAEPVSCFVPTTRLDEFQAAQIRAERDNHLAASFRVDSIYRDLTGGDEPAIPNYEVPTDLTQFWSSPVAISELPALALYGYRIHPIYGSLRWHNGIDVVHPVGVPVQSLAAGTVVAAGWIGGYGNTIVIDHGSGFSTVSAHLAAFEVAVGESVEAGQVVGAIGRTGRVTGPHLHFETRLGGVPVDPHWFIGDLRQPSSSVASRDTAYFQIQRLYQQAFDRLPNGSALEFWIEQCRDGRSLIEVAERITEGDEFATRFGDDESVTVESIVEAAEDEVFVEEIASELIDPSVRRLYRAVLGRSPDADGGYYWTAQLQSGQLLVSLAEQIGTSPEYEARFGVSSTEAFVEQSYRLVFGREPDAEGLAFWVARAEATSRWDVLVGFAESPEGQALL